MTRIEQDRPATGSVPDGMRRCPGCPLCGIPPFDSPDETLVAQFERAHQP